ncbi:MAG: TMEM14 family protein [Cyanobacteria bacterium P01_E01_bin.42]
MSLGTIAAIVYGILAIAGGIMGYLQAKSKISLISGCSSGAVLLIAGLSSLQGQNWGLTVAIAVTAILVLTFVIRLAKTRKMMPAGLMIGLGVPALALMVLVG